MSCDGRSPAVRILVPAGGSGSRFGGQTPKLLCRVGGEPILVRTIRRLLALEPASLIVATPAGCRDLYEGAAAGAGTEAVVWVDGGPSRAASVLRCFAACPEGREEELIMVHDAARPLVSLEDCRRVLSAAAESGAAVLGRTPVETVKRRLPADRVATIPRHRLFLAETPQVVRRDRFAAACSRQAPDAAVTDDVQWLEAADLPCALVEASAPNPKLTHRHELPLFEALLEWSVASAEPAGPAEARR